MYVKLNMAVSLNPSYLDAALDFILWPCFTIIYSGGRPGFKIYSVIINLTSRPPYAILLLDYPMDNHYPMFRRG